MKKIITICFVVLSFEKAIAQQLLWNNTYSISGYNYFQSRNFIELPDSGFLMNCKAGPTVLELPLLIRVNKNGDTVETRLFDITPYHSYFADMKSVDDTTIIVTSGLWNQNYGINSVNINLNSFDTLNYHFFGDSGVGSAGGILRVSDKGYFLANNAAGNYKIIKTDSNLNEEWHYNPIMTLSGTGLETYDSSYISVGFDDPPKKPYWLVAYDFYGAIKWNRKYGQYPNNYSNWINGIVNLEDSNLLVTCSGLDIRFMKINVHTGDTMWTKFYFTKYWQPYKIGYDKYVCFTDDTLLTVFNGNADILYTINLPFGGHLAPIQLLKTKDGGFAIFGEYAVQPWVPLWRYPILIKTDSLFNIVFTSIFNFDNSKGPISFYPNPTSSELYINTSTFLNEKNVSITLTNVQGKQVLQQGYDKSKAFDVSNLPNGIYVAEVRGKEKVVRGKVVVQH